MDRSPPGSSVHGISQVRILEWVAISFSRGSGILEWVAISFSRGSSRARGLPLAHIYWIPVMADLLKTEPWSRGAASSAKVWALEHTALGQSAASLHPSRVAFGKSSSLREPGSHLQNGNNDPICLMELMRIKYRKALSTKHACMHMVSTPKI